MYHSVIANRHSPSYNDRMDPFPTIKRTGSLGTPDEEKAGYTYEVTLIGRKTLMDVIDAVGDGNRHFHLHLHLRGNGAADFIHDSVCLHSCLG